jgi:Seed maturation protein.
MTKGKQQPMTPAAAARIQSSTTKTNGGQTPKDSFAARAQSSASKNSKN